MKNKLFDNLLFFFFLSPFLLSFFLLHRQRSDTKSFSYSIEYAHLDRRQKHMRAHTHIHRFDRNHFFSYILEIIFASSNTMQPISLLLMFIVGYLTLIAMTSAFSVRLYF